MKHMGLGSEAVRERNSWARLEERHKKKESELVAVKVSPRGRALCSQPLSNAHCQWFAHGSGIKKAWVWFMAGVY